MHPQSGLRLLAPFLAFLTNAAADTSAPFELISHVLHPPNPTLDGLYYASFDFHPGGFYFGTISDPSVLSPLVSFLNGTAEELAAGNGTLETTDIPGDSETYAFDISPGVPNYAPSVYDYVGLNPPGEVVTFGLHFVNGVLKYKGLKGHFYGKFLVELGLYRGLDTDYHRT